MNARIESEPYWDLDLDNITLQPKTELGQEPWEFLLVFHAHPSELSLELSKIHVWQPCDAA